MATPEASGTAAAVLAAVGGLLLAVALASLTSESGLRRLYGLDPTDDAGARTNALVVGVVGAGLLALAGGLAVGLPGRAIALATLLASAGLCGWLGWLLRYRDRRELLNLPGEPDRRTTRRVGAAVAFAGLLLLPVAAVIALGLGDAVVVPVALAASFAATAAVLAAAR